jgi:hypothetical protein
MKEELIKLLDRYYAGETTAEEESYLKAEILDSGESVPEKEIFTYFSSGPVIPENTENTLFSRIEEKTNRKKIRITILRSLSAAAGLLFLISLYTGYLHNQKAKKDLKTMEQALSMVSGSLQPGEEEPEMLVLWVDNNVEVIIN